MTASATPTPGTHPMAPKTYPSFRRDTRAPRLPPPHGSCDCHVHVFDVHGTYRLRAERAYEPPAAGLDELLQMHATLGITRGVLVQPTAYGTDHRALVDALARVPDRYRGVAIVDDTLSEADLAGLHAAGVRGARFSFASFLRIAPTPEQFARSVARVRALGWHIKIFTAGDELLERIRLVENLDLPVVFDHMGFIEPGRGANQPAFRLLLDLLREHENFWVTLSNGDRRSQAGPPWDDVRPYVEAFVAAAPDRAVWCTDWPHLTYEHAMPNDAELLEFLYRCVPDAALRHRILVDNPARLYGFEAAAAPRAG